MKGLFVAGTDTEIGKTTISAGLVQVFSLAGLSVAPIKPLSAGQELVNGRWVNEDVQRLLSSTALALSETDVGPLQLRTPCAPHIAIQRERVSVDRSSLLLTVQRTALRADVCIVEGVGGFLVPITDTWDTADLAVDLQLPVVLVVGMRLGCINHALLTAESIRSRGLVLAGWVANLVDIHMQFLDSNVSALEERLCAPCWGNVPRLPAATPLAVAAHLNHSLALKALQHQS